MRTPLVLIVEDDDSIRELTRVSLEVIAGWDVVVAPHGAAGVQLARSQQPDLVLLDLVMPGQTGIDVFKTLQSDDRTSAIPVILLTARSAPVVGPAPWEPYGFRGVIAKPFDPVTLSNQLVDLLGESFLSWPISADRENRQTF